VTNLHNQDEIGKPDLTQVPAMVDQLRGQLTFKGDQGA
jgi:hypothetical protein